MTHEEALKAISYHMSVVSHSARVHAATCKRAEGEIAEALEVLQDTPKSDEAIKNGAVMTRNETLARAMEHIKANLRKVESAGLTHEFRFVSHKKGNRMVSIYPGSLDHQTTCIISDTKRYRVIGIGRSWCSRGDEFSPTIGKAIALYRALGREVPEWLLHIPQE